MRIRIGWTALLLAVGLSVAGGARAAVIDPPPGNWGPGDIPATGGAPQGFDYIGITGVAGQAGLTREYKVHVPPGYDGHAPVPLVFCFHGVSETTSMFCVRGTNTDPFRGNGTSGGMIDQADRNGFVLVMVEGYGHSWNGGDCCGPAQRKDLDDVALVRAILGVVQQHLKVDASRVYAVGFSNGGFLADRLACEASDIIAGVVEASGGIRIPMTDCTPSAPVSVLGTHGEGGLDYWVPYDGDLQSMQHFAQVNGCSATSVPAAYPPSQGSGNGAVDCQTWPGCRGGAEVTFCSVHNGGHCWFGSPSCGTGFGEIAARISLGLGVNTRDVVDSSIVWPFLSQHRR